MDRVIWSTCTTINAAIRITRPRSEFMRYHLSTSCTVIIIFFILTSTIITNPVHRCSLDKKKDRRDIGGFSLLSGGCGRYCPGVLETQHNNYPTSVPVFQSFGTRPPYRGTFWNLSRSVVRVTGVTGPSQTDYTSTTSLTVAVASVASVRSITTVLSFIFS